MTLEDCQAKLRERLAQLREKIAVAEKEKCDLDHANSITNKQIAEIEFALHQVQQIGEPDVKELNAKPPFR